MIKCDSGIKYILLLYTKWNIIILLIVKKIAEIFFCMDSKSVYPYCEYC